MNVRVLGLVSLVVAVVFAWNAAGVAGEAKKVTKEMLAGEWKHTPGDIPAFDLRPDGVGTLNTGTQGACSWDYNKDYQILVIATNRLKRQYKVHLEEGRILLDEGREVYRSGTSMNALLSSPLDKAHKPLPAKEEPKAEPKEEPKKPE